jgi:D-glycero-D-manno-heptose 1,7-bisphosphate phosphatase
MPPKPKSFCEAMKNKAVFLDRDGVVNELVYYAEQEIIDSPFTPAGFKLLPGVTGAINMLRRSGFLVVLVSNQPGIAKGHLSPAAFESIRQKMISDLAVDGSSLDAEYYCLHHPQAVIQQYQINCDCRKPGPGLLKKASLEMDIDLAQSWLVGDNLSDILAGKNAGCRTILLGKMKCEMCRLMDEQDVRPDQILSTLGEAGAYILKELTA